MFTRAFSTLRTHPRRNALLAATAATTVGVGLVALTQPRLASPLNTIEADSARGDPSQLWTPPSRATQLARLGCPNSLKVDKVECFDLLIVGGGATGAGCALDAATRGLSVAMVEKDDFAAGTSSRSTKLVHGGVRYLEKAFKELDIEQYKLVVEALHERSVFLKIAPYLSYQLPIMLPVYSYWKMPYFFVGAKMYEFLAGAEGINSSYFVGKRKALEAFPMLKGDNLVGAMIYYDGAHNDSRMNVAIALTAVAHGAVIANHVEVVELIKKPRTFFGPKGLGEQEICGAVVRDVLTGVSWTIKAKGVINATGPFSDGLRKLDTGFTTKEIVAPSAGVHIILPSYFSPRNMGLLDPETSDGRVIFFLPWQGNVIAGTTDSPATVEANPMPSEDDIGWILREIENYLDPSIKVRRGDVLAAWSGIRPLVRDPAAKNTAGLVRNHMINVSESGLLTIAGGKWTTYRSMAQETIDVAIEKFGLTHAGPCVTERTALIGTGQWSHNMYIKLIQSFGIETEVAKHLADSYGDHAWAVASMASMTGQRWPIHGKKLTPNYPYIEAEVRYAVRNEYAQTAVDVLARRMRLAMLNAQAAKETLPRVIEIMSSELNWTKSREAQEYSQAIEFLSCMGLKYLENTAKLNPEDSTYYTRSHFVPEELSRYEQEFAKFSYQKDGRIRVKDLSYALKAVGESGSPDAVLKTLSVGGGAKGTLEFGEFLEVLSAIREKRHRDKFASSSPAEGRDGVHTSRSGGGV
ncbi:mitochondrial glycerol-3-phosphate dehydrogenase [Podochytrium sp. JEL0797]|nr:mitochondrial glycerol-3-phosphate dehydrogenase [Podochytrium sp. JEL0797]